MASNKKTWSGWDNLGITRKFSLAFALLLTLIMLLAATGYISLVTVRKAEQQIETSTRIGHLAHEMGRATDQAHRLHSDFLLLYPTLGLAKAHERYAQPSIRRIAKAISLSSSLREALSLPGINSGLQIRKADVNLYLSSAKRFADTSIQTVELITERAAPETGLEARLQRVSLALQAKSAGLAEQESMLMTALLQYRDYLISRRRSDMQSAFNSLYLLRNSIAADDSRLVDEKNDLYDLIEQFQSIAWRLLDIDLAVRAKLNDFSLQERIITPVSDALLTQAGGELVQARQRIAEIHRTAVWCMVAIGLFAAAAAVIVGRILHNTITRKIIGLTQAADKFREGSLDVVFMVKGRDELGTLASTFNQMVANIRDLVDNLEQRVAERESFYRSLFDHSSSGVVVYEAVDNGQDFIFRDINKASERMDKVNRDELLGKRVTEAFPMVEEFGLLDIFRRVWQDGQPINHPISLYDDGRITAWRENRVYKLPGGELVAVYSDVTEQKQLEEEKQFVEAKLQRAQKMEAIGLLAGGVAHDLNNILSGITGYPELLLMQLPQDSRLRASIMAIQESGERAVAVVADLLTVARGVAGVREPALLNTLIMEYLAAPEFLKLEKLHPEVEVKHELAAILPIISCSPVHIKKCIMNLVINGAEAIDDQGSVFLKTRSEIPDDKLAGTYGLQQGEHVVFSVTDTGSGIKEEDLEHIFEPFYSKKVMGKSGTGLGLAVVWNTMEDHHGAVLVTSSSAGTTFELYFPAAAEQEMPQADKPTGIQELYGHGETILVVDDEPVQRDIAGNMLQSLGYQVSSAQSGEEAVAMMRDGQADLLLLDMLMAPGINGRQTYEQIVKIHPGQRAVIASGFSESKEVNRARQLGATSFLKKPYSMVELGRAVQDALEAEGER